MSAVSAMALKLALVDVSGTLMVGSATVSGAPEALQNLRSGGVNVLFVTNTTTECADDLVQKLRAAGFVVDRDDMHTSLTAAADLVSQRGLRPLLLLSKSARRDFPGDLEDDIDHDSVVVGLAPERLNYEWLDRAFAILDRGGELIAIHEGKYLKGNDRLILGPGPFVRALEYCSGKKAQVIGKPSTAFFQSALARFGISADEAVIIGDDAQSDAAGALAAGLRSGLVVQTGKYRPGDELRADPSPSATVPDFPAAVDWIIRCNRRQQQQQQSSPAGTG